MALHMDRYNLEFVPDHFETEYMCNKAVHIKFVLL